MWKRAAGVVACAILLMGCQGTREYTVSQAEVDMPTYEHANHAYSHAYDECVAQNLFDRLSPGQVKTMIRGADFGDPPLMMSQAQDECAGVP